MVYTLCSFSQTMLTKDDLGHFQLEKPGMHCSWVDAFQHNGCSLENDLPPHQKAVAAARIMVVIF